MLGVMLMVLMGCGTKSSFVKTNYAMEVKHVEAAGKQLMVMMPGRDAQVQFVSHKQSDFAGAPSIAHSGILLNVAAAFTLDTESMDVCGDHVVAGERIRGYDDVTATGHMLIINNKVSIKGNSCLEQSIQEAVAASGYLFQQCYIVEDGRAVVERIPQAILDRQPHILFRAACVMKGGEFAVVQGGEEMFPAEFVNSLVALGVQQALYLDMGTWAWGWIRENGKPPQELTEKYQNTRYQSNWLQVTR